MARDFLEAQGMTDLSIISPADCGSMTDVRAGVDATDIELIALLARRFGYMDAAARIKHDRESVRDEVRKAQVIENVTREAAKLGIPGGLVAELWERLIEASIAHEFVEWDRVRV